MNTKRTNPSCRPGATEAMERLAAENEALRATKAEAVALVYEGNEIIKEAMEEIQRLNGELGKAKAAGAREALRRAMKPNFSDTVVRVDALQAVIEKMEKDNG